MRLEAEGAPDATDRGLAHPRRLGHRARGPVRRVDGPLLEGLHDHRLDAGVLDASRHTGTLFVEEPAETIRAEANPPLADGDGVDPELRGNLAVRLSLRDTEDDACPEREGPGRRPPTGQRLEFSALGFRKHDLDRSPTPSRTLLHHRYDHIHSPRDYTRESLTQTLGMDETTAFRAGPVARCDSRKPWRWQP